MCIRDRRSPAPCEPIASASSSRAWAEPLPAAASEAASEGNARAELVAAGRGRLGAGALRAPRG
eukprot:8997818-Alexandrium_andersonii.AAC.1